MRARKNNRFPAGRGAELRAASNPVRGDPERRTESNSCRGDPKHRTESNPCRGDPKRRTASNPCRGDLLEQEVQKELLFLSIKEELIKAGLIKWRGKDDNKN